MNIKSIYVNLPVNDLDQTRNFWNQLGFTFNEQFSNHKGLCLQLNEGTIYSMLIKKEYFIPFTNRPIADGTTTQVLVAIEVDSRENVDDMIKTAIANGATRYRVAEDHGWMYLDGFSDHDHHQWEVLYMDSNKIPKVN